jgi:hypothetical protein
MKICTKCGSVVYALGLCKKHYKAQWIKNHRERVNAYNRRWQAEHREEHLARRRIQSLRSSTKFSGLKSQSKVRGVILTLSLEELTNLISGPCDYCKGTLPEVGYGLDRKDNALGYTLENSVPCCTRCNTMKGSLLTYEEMKLIWRNRNANTSREIAENGRRQS